jgi:acyl carrier protein
MTLSPENAIVEVKRVIEGLTSVPITELHDEDLISDLLAGDSLSYVEYKLALELRFAISLESIDWKNLGTIRSTAAYVSTIVSNRDKYSG